MKIGIYSDILENTATGVENYTKNLILNLKIRPIIIYSKEKIDLSIFKDFPKIHWKRKHFLGSTSFYAFFKPLRTNLDLVHCPTVSTPFFCKSKTKLILTVHDLIPLIFPQYHNLRRNIYFRLFLKPALTRADKIIAVSNNTKADLIKYFHLSEAKIKVIHLGVDNKFKPTINKEILIKYNLPTDYLLFVGTLEPRKNLERLIQAYNSLHITQKLVIVGKKGWDYKKLLKHKNIQFTDYVEEKDLPAIYSQAKLFIYPSLYEGFGLPVLEAMACGCPTITSNLSSLPEVAGDAALLINPYSVQDIARAINKLLNNSQLRLELSRKGLIQSKKFTWKQCAAQTYQLYQEVLKDT